MQKGNSTLILVLLAALLLLGGGYYFQQMGSETNETTDKMMKGGDKHLMEDGEDIDLEDTEMEITNSMKMMVGDENTLSGELEDVSGGTSSGTAYVLRKDDSLFHFVEAQMPKPAEGSVYEGWLVNRSNGVKFFSTGIMEETVDGVYTLTYESKDTSEGYNFVVITEETVVDETPEVHIIEGEVN